MPASRCDLDHRRPHAEGGPTCPCNLAPVCRRHHLAKHRYGWSVEPVTDDPRDTGVRWRSPLGQVAVVPGEPFLPAPVDLGRARGAGRGDDGAAPAYPAGDDAVHDARRTRRVTRAEAARREALTREAARTAARSAVGAEDPPPS